MLLGDKHLSSLWDTSALPWLSHGYPMWSLWHFYVIDNIHHVCTWCSDWKENLSCTRVQIWQALESWGGWAHHQMLTPLAQPASLPDVCRGGLGVAKGCSVFLWCFNTGRIWNLIAENTFDEKKIKLRKLQPPDIVICIPEHVGWVCSKII